MGLAIRLVVVSALRATGLALAALAVVAAHGLSASAATPPPRVTVIGDSVASAMTSLPDVVDQLGAGIDLRLELAVCRRLVDASCPYGGSRPTTALELIRDESRPLGTIVAIDVGYNEFVANFPDSVNTVMQALVKAGVEHVLWVTLSEERASYATMNDELRDAATRWPQIAIVDWNAASAGKPWFGDDGLHLNADGARSLAALLRGAIVEVCGQECVPKPPPPVRVPVAVPVLVSSPALALSLPEGWSLAAGGWRRWSGVEAGWLGPAVTGAVGAGPSRIGLAVMLRPVGTSIAAIRSEILAKPARVEGRAGGIRVVGERLLRVGSNRVWQLDVRDSHGASARSLRWTFVGGGAARLHSGASRTLIYAFRASCDASRCEDARTLLSRIVASVAIN